MVKQRRFVSAAGLAILLSTTGLAPVAAAPGPAEPSPPPATLRYWARTRAAFGLDSSRQQLLRVAGDPAATSFDIGVPISAAEHAEMVRRQGLGVYVGAIERAGRGSSLYGGVAIDQAAGGVVVIKIVRSDLAGGPGRALAAQLRSIVPSADPTTVQAVSYSEATLRRADRRINRAFATGALKRYAVTFTSDRDQAVVMGIAPSAPAGTAAALHWRFPWPFLVVTRSAGVVLQPARDRQPR